MGLKQRAELGTTSFVFFVLSGLSYRLYRKAISDADAVENAFEVTPESIRTLPTVLQTKPKRRMLIKVSGSLMSPKPLTAPNATDQPAVLVRETSRSFATNRVTLDTELSKSFAEDVEIKVDESGPDPKLILSPNLLETLEPSLVVSKQTFEKNRWLSSILSMFFVNLAWRQVDTTSVIPQGTRVFATLDAVADTNGRISLIESQQISDRFIITRRHYNQIIDDKRDAVTVWKGFSISTGAIACILAAAATLSN